MECLGSGMGRVGALFFQKMDMMGLLLSTPTKFGESSLLL